MFDKIVQVILLYDFYGQLLTPKQIEVMDMHYNEDLSLSEISEQLNISRQGVHDSLRRAENALLEYEEKLGLVKRFKEQKDNLDKILFMLDDVLSNEINDSKLIDELKEVRKFITNIL